jgi:hypothetical protein
MTVTEGLICTIKGLGSSPCLMIIPPLSLNVTTFNIIFSIISLSRGGRILVKGERWIIIN